MADEPFRLIEGSPGYDVPLILEIHRITGLQRDETVLYYGTNRGEKRDYPLFVWVDSTIELGFVS